MSYSSLYRKKKKKKKMELTIKRKKHWDVFCTIMSHLLNKNLIAIKVLKIRTAKNKFFISKDDILTTIVNPISHPQI